ncbi:hypothetical protein BGZ80_010541 [Entomortierella chlamydospora]|uniref:Uncharacterized protein n=1 Tax=Entomortierella chlamydospora TaxID=101097 RepID=A0A9P6SZN7_9FUNG|nr:hypothetical protein BGZ80_010541 [Entomortierella chlamydospora]
MTITFTVLMEYYQLRMIKNDINMQIDGEGYGGADSEQNGSEQQSEVATLGQSHVEYGLLGHVGDIPSALDYCDNDNGEEREDIGEEEDKEDAGGVEDVEEGS